MVSKSIGVTEMLIASASHLILKTTTPTKGLIIDGLHLERILEGTGSFEMRSGFTNRCELIALIKQDCNLIVGIANLVGIYKPLGYQTYHQPSDQERVSEERLQSGNIDNWDIAWVLENSRTLLKAVSCPAFNDIDRWVNLKPQLQEQLMLAMDSTD
ncbi:MAG: hypothetical protein WCP01_17505 [Methylococcaceae bacterium]